MTAGLAWGAGGRGVWVGRGTWPLFASGRLARGQRPAGQRPAGGQRMAAEQAGRCIGGGRERDGVLG
jgi:hypothetical protein